MKHRYPESHPLSKVGRSSAVYHVEIQIIVIFQFFFALRIYQVGISQHFGYLVGVLDISRQNMTVVKIFYLVPPLSPQPSTADRGCHATDPRS